MNKKVFLILVASFIYTISSAQEYNVSGYIKDAQKQEPIIGAAVFEAYSVVNGTPTDTEGYFTLDFEKSKVVIKVAYIGFKDTILNLTLTEDTIITVFLKSDTDIEAVEIDREKDKWKPEDNSIVGNNKVIKVQRFNAKSEMPQGQFSIPKIKNELLINDLNVLSIQKGQGVNQALTFIDGARLYSSKQAFDFMPLIDKNSIKSIKYFYNCYPANYGGYISPVLDINMQEGDMDSFKGNGTVSLHNAKLNVGGPIIEDVSSFFASAGISYFNNPYTDLFRKESVNQLWTKPNSYNLFLKYTHQLSKNDKFYTSFYATSDENKYSYKEDVLDSISYTFENNISDRTTNTLMSAHWEHKFSPDFTSKLYFTYSRYNMQQSFTGDSIGLVAGNRSRINNHTSEYTTGNDDLSFNMNFKYNAISDHNIEFGGNAINHNFRPAKGMLEITDFEHGSSIDTTFEADAYNVQEYIVFVQDKYTVSNELWLKGGIHFSTFVSENKTYFSVQPRIFANYNLLDWVSLSVSYSNYERYVHALENRQVGLTTDVFIASDENILPQFTHHFSAGASLELPFGINLSSDVFYENSINVSEYKDKYGFYNNDDKFNYAGMDLKSRIEQGKETVFGVRVIVNKDFEKFSVKAAHYMSYSNRTFPNLNFSKSFSYRYNNTHDFSIKMSYKITEEFSAGIDWMYKSGNFITPSGSSYLTYNYDAGLLSAQQVEKDVFSTEGELITNTGDINTLKLPAYHRADLFLSYTIDNHIIGLNIYNLYSKKNPEYIDFRRGSMTNADMYQLTSFTTLPFFPVLSYTYRFE